jgi:hypothetical protein
MITGYLRVSRRSPCRICGKPDWCSTTKDQNISFCARSATNADRLSGNGWGIYYSNLGSQFRAGQIFKRKQRIRSSPMPMASIELRNTIYRNLIELSPISRSWELNLESESPVGQKSCEFYRYGMLPKTTLERQRLARLLVKPDGGTFPSFIGVPGFWRGSNGSLQLGSNFDYNADLLLIPFFTSNGLIQACQIKILGNTPNRSAKYLWLSSVRQPDGCGPGTPLHHEGAVGFKGKRFEIVLITEGALKAATAQKFLPDRYVVGNSGVATSHKEIVKAARKKDLEIAFDADCFTNPHVARALASLIALRIREQQFLSYDHPVRILTWDKRFKGIDDALIAEATLKHLEVHEWLRALTTECFEVASHQLSGISVSKISG